MTLRNVAELLTRLGDDRSAAELLGGITGRSTAGPVFGADADRLARLRAGLTDRLGPSAVEQAAARGAVLDDNGVLDLARRALTAAQG